MGLLALMPILVAIGVVGALITFPWRTRRLGKGWPWLPTTLLPALAAYALGWAFVVTPGDRHQAATQVDILWGLLCVSIALVVAMPLLLKERRLFGASIAVAMVGVTMFTTFVASMQVTGDWI